ncbi:hypothetical protein BDN72DRAFT_861391 [Pluteus cervinus]|uniref:Uncharacterized protein n=1 Tax=Pluteus cervinus TaxID=181527 RepID=A0ACD3AFG4_9AGAR|nr:hypothetical protein BDN72DRAFT_861391 [Pluteus cervinus]
MASYISIAPNALLDHFSLGELLRLSRVCHAVRDRVSTYLDDHLSPSVLLRPYFTPPQIDVFAALQQDAGILITGMTAFHFINRSLSRSTRLDLLVDDSNSDGLIVWLQVVGYTGMALPPIEYPDSDDSVDDDDVQPDAVVSPSFVQDVMHFENAEHRVIRLVLSRSDPIAVILGSSITSAMNFLSATGAYCLYPHSTLERFEGLRIHNGTGDIDGFSVDFFEAQGGTVIERLSDAERNNPSSDFYTGNGIPSRRVIGDRKTWMFLLVTDAPLLDPPSWWLVYHNNRAYTQLDRMPSSSHAGFVQLSFW